MAIDVFAAAPQTLIGILCNSTLGVRRREHANDSPDRTLLVECFNRIAMPAGRVPPARARALDMVARREHARRAIQIAAESFGIAP